MQTEHHKHLLLFLLSHVKTIASLKKKKDFTLLLENVGFVFSVIQEQKTHFNSKFDNDIGKIIHT